MYATVGYSTVYLYYAYPEHIRPRISQMLVLPPFQKLGIGSKMIEVSNGGAVLTHVNVKNFDRYSVDNLQSIQSR